MSGGAAKILIPVALIGATAVTGGAAAPAAGAAGGAAGGLSGASLLSGGLAILSAGAQILSGFQAKAVADAEAELDEFRAEQEESRGIQEEAEIARQLNEELGENAAHSAAFATPLGGVTRGLQERREHELTISRINTASNARARRLSASAARARGKNAVISGFAGAAGSLAPLARRKAET